MLGAKSVTCYLVFSTVLFTALANAQFGPRPECGADAVGGIVYRDYNFNGTRDQNEPGELGVLVQAFGPNGSLVASATTDIDGAYKIESVSGALRVEFSVSGVALTSGPVGAQSQSTVTFSSSGNCNVDLAVTNSSEFCQENPDVAIPRYNSGDPLAVQGDAGSGSALVKFPYNASGTPPNAPEPDLLALSREIGTTWGVAYQRASKKVFAAATLKRHAGFGPLGTGGIYQVDLNTIPATVTNFLDLNALGINTGVDPRTLPGDPGLPGIVEARSLDPNAFAGVGHVGLGDIDISEDQESLWVINLFDRKLYRINIGLPANTPDPSDIEAFEIPNPGCSNNDFAPWGLKIKDGVTYVGVVCTAETSQDKNDLHAYVLKLSLGTFSSIFDLALDYPRGYSGAPALNPKPGNGEQSQWNPWARDMDDIHVLTTRFAHIGYPQPILSNIDFDSDGSIILGFMDRTGQQLSLVQPPPNNPEATVGLASGGDLLRACAVGSNLWVLENNASCPGNPPTVGENNAQGPGGGEYYAQDYWRALFQGQVIDVHQETALGSFVNKPGANEVLATYFDVLSFLDSGVRAVNNQNGEYNRGYEVYNQSERGTFGKAVGLGDMELLCDSAPCEIGNRVWLDEDGDGSQDAGEIGIPGITLNLYEESSGTLIASTTTNDSGEYLFTNANGVECGRSYKIKLDNSADYSSTGALFALILTSADGDEDQRDSDARIEDGFGTISLTTAAEGESNHTYDVGFSVPQCVTQDLTEINSSIDGSTLALERLVKSALKTRRTALNSKYGASCPLLSAKKEDKISEQASALHLSAWSSIWSIGPVATDCGESLSSACVSTDVSGTLASVTADSEALYGLVAQSFKGCKVKDRKKTRIEKRALTEITQIRSDVEELSALNPFSSCPSGF